MIETSFTKLILHVYRIQSKRFFFSFTTDDTLPETHHFSFNKNI